MVQVRSHCSSGYSTRWYHDSSDAHVAAARRSVLLLPLFALSPSRVGQFRKIKSIFSQDFGPISDIFDKESPKFD